jgi:hypothetical protein
MLISAWMFAFVILCGILCLFFGPVGILYSGGIVAWCAFVNLVTHLIVPNADARNDPVYRANVQKLVERQRSEGRSE